MSKKDETYEAITIFVLHMRNGLYTGGGMNRDEFDVSFLGGLGEYERKLAKREEIYILE